MRILHLVSYPLFSGPMPSTVALAVAQRDRGHEVWLAFDRKRGAFNAYEEAAAPSVEQAGLTAPAPFTLSTKSSVREYWRDWRTLKKLVHAGGVDVVHFHFSHDHGLGALAGRGSPAVTRVRTIHAARSLLPRFGQRWLMRRADGFIVRCDDHRRRLTEAFAVPPAHIRVVKGSVDTRRFSPPPIDARVDARRQFELPLDVPVVCHVAFMAGRGQEELAHGAAELGSRAPHLLFVGRGEGEPGLRALVDRLGIGQRVRFAGYLQGNALLKAYAASDAAFLAQAGNDASARAALEAMACGLPLIAVTGEALAELCQPEVGFPIERRDAAAVALALGRWLESADRGKARGQAGRKLVVAERSVAQEAAATVAFYEALRGGAASPLQ